MKKWGFLIVLLAALFFTQDVQAATKIICIDPGHQQKQNSGKEPVAPGSKQLKMKVSSGTSGVSSKQPEYKLTLNVGLKLKKALEKEGYKVFMTRTKNEVNISNAERAQYCNAKKADLTIRLHADGSTNQSVNGISVLYPSNSVTKGINGKSKTIASTMLTQLIKATNAKKAYSSGIVARNDLTGFNWSKTPVILIEMGFMTNIAEDKKLATASYQNKIVLGIVEGVKISIKQ